MKPNLNGVNSDAFIPEARTGAASCRNVSKFESKFKLTKKNPVDYERFSLSLTLSYSSAVISSTRCHAIIPFFAALSPRQRRFPRSFAARSSLSYSHQLSFAIANPFMNFFHLKRPYPRCRILVFRLRYRYRTAIGCPSPLRSNFNRAEGTLTEASLLSPRQGRFHQQLCCQRQSMIYFCTRFIRYLKIFI